MIEHINVQIIEQSGKPAFAVIPFKEYEELLKNKHKEWWGDETPHQVMKSTIKDNISHTKAWRVFLKLTQVEVSKRAGMEQSAYARIENSNKQPKKSTMLKIANAMNITLAQLEF